MKYLIFIMTLVILTSCAGTYRQASYVSSKAYIGMPIKEFRELAGRKASLEAMESGYTVYRMNDYDAWTGALIDTKFYYFDSNGKLVKIDGGEFKQKRYQLEIINN
jgi:hypothetical protein